MEERRLANGNLKEATAPRTQNRDQRASTGLQRVRDAARRDPKCRFTSLLHHITPDLLLDSYHRLKRAASRGVDGVS